MTKYDLFFSYNHKIQNLVKDLERHLTQNHSWNIYLDVNENHIGDCLAKKLSESICSSKIFVCFITSAYCTSENCKDEFSWAQSQKKPMIILMMENCNLTELGEIGFRISRLIRLNAYKNLVEFKAYKGPDFNKFIDEICLNLNSLENITDKKTELKYILVFALKLKFF
jgi:hypothetical protein